MEQPTTDDQNDPRRPEWEIPASDGDGVPVEQDEDAELTPVGA